MTVEEIVAVIIDSASVTSNAGEIDAALLFGHRVDYVSRERARSLSVWRKQSEWQALAEAPALFVIVDGRRYRQYHGERPVSFALSTTARQGSSASAG